MKPLAIILAGLHLLIPMLAVAQAPLETPSMPLISEVQTGSADSATQEFVELYNPDDMSWNLNGWVLEYKSSTGAEWSMAALLSGVIGPRGFYLVAPNDYFSNANDELTKNLAAGGGHLRLLGPGGQNETAEWLEYDRLGWGVADSPETAAATAPDAGQSLKRRFEAEINVVDTNNNADDFVISELPDPSIAPSLATEAPEDEESSTEPETPVTGPTPTVPSSYLSVEVREIFPDPDSPLKDDTDEFVELYNPHSQAINLKDYTIQTGGNLQYDFVLPNLILPAKGYRVFYSRQGNITLPNGGGRVQVVDPASKAASNLVTYPEAETGQAWAKLGNKFAWTNRPTPGKPNLPSVMVAEEAGGNSTGRATTTAGTRTDYPKLQLTELFPDPDDPLKDSDDEFVEIYNPNDFAVELEGYVIKSGSTLRSKFSLPAGAIKPGEYQVFFSDAANISLTNKGGLVRLEGENEKLVDETKPYPKAETGAAWAIIDSKWQWTAKPTPGAPNELAALAGSGATAGSNGGSVESARDAALEDMSAPTTITASPWSIGLVAAGSAFALLYVAYEYRHDLRNRFELARRYFSNRKQARLQF